MYKAVIFGASKSGIRLYNLIGEKYTIIAFADNEETKWGKELLGIPIIAPHEIATIKYDKIVIASISGLYAIKQQLLDGGVDEYNIDISYVELQVKPREQFLSDFSEIVYRDKIGGAVAEAGVFQGEFAKIINQKFPDRKLYLFDTFEGFDKRDIVYEHRYGFSNEEIGHLNATSESLVLKKMKYPHNCIIRKGYFPDTAIGITDTFCFVNLDMDLYKPTLEGLKFFWDKLTQGGVILIHEYFYEGYKGAARAVEEFRENNKVHLLPIGDSLSIAMIKA